MLSKIYYVMLARGSHVNRDRTHTKSSKNKTSKSASPEQCIESKTNRLMNCMQLFIDLLEVFFNPISRFT